MALIIDGTTFNGWWKFTADDAAPNDYQMVPKSYPLDFTVTGATEGAITIGGSAYATGTTTIDAEGNALNTSEKVAQYLSDKR